MKLTNLKVGDWVVVRWDDAVSTDGWKTIEELSDVVGVTSIGQVVAAGQKQIVLAATVMDGDEKSKPLYSEVIAIPAGFVTDIQKLGTIPQ